MKFRVYLDTSVIGGYFDEEFEKETKDFFDRIFNNDFLVYFSEVSEAELALAPEFVKKLKEKILGKASLDDAYHIAIATVNRLDLLVSWNFKHIVNYDKIRLFNSVNLKLGYPVIEIRSPKDLSKYENND